MQAVILAAGRGTRMGTLTEAMPKPMLQVAGRSLLEHKFEVLPEAVDEVILVVGYMGHIVQQFFGGEFAGKRILYMLQENPTGGTAEALWLAKDILKDKFLVMNGDNLYGAEDIAACTAYDWAVLVQERGHVSSGRVVVKNGLVRDIAENSGHKGEKGYANTGLYALDMRIFDYPPAPKAPGSEELGLPQTMIQAVNDIDIHAVPANFWFEIKSPADLKRAEEALAAL